MSSSAELVCVPPQEARTVWPRIEKWIDAAMRRGDLGLSKSVKDDVLWGRALIWLVWNKPTLIGAVVTQVSEVESGKVCTLVACGGDGVLNALPLLSTIEHYAKKEGCRSMRVMGRRGWVRALRGYRTARVVLEKELQ